MSKEFHEELARRIAILSDPDYDDISYRPLEKIDYAMIGFSILVSVLIFIWGWM